MPKILLLTQCRLLRKVVNQSHPQEEPLYCTRLVYRMSPGSQTKIKGCNIFFFLHFSKNSVAAH